MLFSGLQGRAGKRLIGYTFTEHAYKTIAALVGGEFLDCHIPGVYFIHDVVGDDPRLKPLMEEWRLVGVQFRYFKTHHERLDEFQKRLDAAFKRQGMTRPKRYNPHDILPPLLYYETCGKYGNTIR